jgi:8-oxo-dGTP pyrophosphatase MutT (NUDIX family)
LIPSSQDLESVLLDPASVVPVATDAVAAAVLVGIYQRGDDLYLVLTKRQQSLQQHPGEISFPGGRREPPETLAQTALREAEEEIGLPRSDVKLVGALPPVDTQATGYTIYPFVGLIGDTPPWRLSPTEVERVIAPLLDDVRRGYGVRKLKLRGLTLATETYLVDGDLIWGATARIVTALLARWRRASRKTESRLRSGAV